METIMSTQFQTEPKQFKRGDKLNWSDCRELRCKTAGENFVDRIHNGFDKLKFTLKFGNLDGYKFHGQGMNKGRKLWVGRYRLQYWRDKDFKLLRD